MKNIIICGDSHDRRLTDTIISSLKNIGGVFVNDGKNIYATSEKPEFSITCTEKFKSIDISGIVIFGNDIIEPDEKCDVKNAVCITDSSNKAALNILKNSECCVIGCSMSGRDTLTISCITDENKLISLQRNIRTLDGDTAEPCEIKIFSSADMPAFTALAVCAVYILCGLPYEVDIHI